MLDGLRNASQSWFGKAIMTVVFGVIIVSFGIWGVGDMIRAPSTAQLATVGKATISAEAFRSAYQTELQRLQRQLGRVVTSEQARAFGVDRQVLSRLTTQAALDQATAELGLAMSDAQVAKSITQEPNFKNKAGQFDRAQFDAILRDNGFTEASFVREQRSSYMRQALADALTARVEAPELMSEAIDRYRNETRSIEYFILPAAPVSTEPDAATLEQFFKERSAQFALPEYRKITFLKLTPTLAAKPDEIAAADVQKLYEAEKAKRFTVPEKRRVQQILFPGAAEAQAAFNKVKAGATFEQIAKEQNKSDKEIDLGLGPQSAFEKAIGDAAFGLALNIVSAPVQGAFGVALLRATESVPAQIKPLKDVEQDLRKELAQQAAAKSVSGLHDKIEDQRSSGKPLAEAAAAVGLTARVIDGVDAQGRDKQGKPVADLAGDKDALAAIFKSDVGVDNEAVVTRDNGHEWFEIISVEPARAQTLEEAKPAVLAAWKATEAQKALQTTAADLVKKLRAGESIETLAKTTGAKLEHSASVKRVGAQGIEEAALVQIFNEPNGGAGQAAVTGGRMIFKVLDSATPAYNADSDVSKQIAAQLKTQITDDLVGEYVRLLEKTYTVKVNETLFRAAAGGQADP